MVTPSANRNSYRAAPPYYIYTQGRVAVPLNPGLRNRNSYRVARVRPVHHKHHPNLPRGEGKKLIQRLHTSLFQEKKRNHNLLKHSENEFPPLGEGWGGAYYQLFFYRQRRSFFTANGRFLNHAGCCRHARHGVGGGGDDKKENSFSDCRPRQPPKGEADNSRHGFLCLYQPLIEAVINGLIPQLASRKQRQL